MTAKEQYIQFAANQDTIPVFAQPWWLDEVSSHWDVVLVHHAGTIVAAFPFTMEKKWGLKLLRNPAFTPYMGPLFFDSSIAQSALLKQLWSQIPRYDSFDLQPYPSLDDGGFFSSKSFQSKKRITYWLDLEQEETTLFSGMHANHRNLIRQAAKIHKVRQDPDYAPFLVQLHEATYQKKGLRYPYPSGLLFRLIKESIRHQQAALYFTETEAGELSAGVFIVWDRQHAYLLVTAGAGPDTHPGAVRLLIYEAIKFAQKNGCSQFDFEGSIEPGIASFFRRFGGAEKEYWEWRHYPSSLWRLKKTLLG